MEDVQVIESLRANKLDGDPITTQLVKFNNEQMVMKILECKDESEANQVFREVQRLLKAVDCENVNLYKKFAVNWQPENCAMVLSMMTDFHEKGSLAKVISTCRHAEEVIPETTVKKWLGQIVELLATLNAQGINHMNLKPSNIYLKNRSGELLLGDVSTPTMLRDRRLMTRKTAGQWNYTAPESMDGEYTEKSDIWSVGAVVLDMLTCDVMSEEEIQILLVEAQDPESRATLEEILLTISTNYSTSLIGLVRHLLELDPEKRPSASAVTAMRRSSELNRARSLLSDLLSLPFMQSCLILMDDSLSRTAPRVNFAAEPVPRDQGIAAVIEYLDDDVTDDDFIQEAMEYLAELSRDEPGLLGDHALRVINTVMKESVNVEVHIAACLALNNLLVANPSGETYFYPNDAILTVIRSMTSYASSSQLQQAAVMLLLALACNESASVVIGREGGVDAILTAMRTYKENVALVTTCCNAVWALCVNEQNSLVASESGALLAVCDVMKDHEENSIVCEAAAAAILALSLQDSNLSLVGEADCVCLLLSAIEQHPRNAKLVKNSCLALASLIELDEESAYIFMSCERQDRETLQGLDLMTELYEKHKDNAEVAENIATLLMELAQYGDMTPHMLANKIPALMTNMKTAFRRNEAVIGPCDVALSRLTGTDVPIGPVLSAREKLRS